MRTSIILVLAAAALSSSAAEARRPGPMRCPTSGGDSRDPFYGVRASQNMMPGPGPQARPINVTGRYRLDMRSGRLSLVKAWPQGINPRILLLNLRMNPNPIGGGHCLSFNGQFRSRSATRVQITDWHGRSITVRVERAH